MLVLTRRPGESIRIGDEISVLVIEIQRGQVKVAIDAPRDIPVHREEIYQLVKRENVRAARQAADSNPAELWRGSRKGEPKGEE
ncbi:MAG: carbon storage regulator CsrA [Myxococcota bacterium]